MLDWNKYVKNYSNSFLNRKIEPILTIPTTMMFYVDGTKWKMKFIIIIIFLQQRIY